MGCMLTGVHVKTPVFFFLFQKDLPHSNDLTLKKVTFFNKPDWVSWETRSVFWCLDQPSDQIFKPLDAGDTWLKSSISWSGEELYCFYWQLLLNSTHWIYFKMAYHTTICVVVCMFSPCIKKWLLPKCAVCKIKAIDLLIAYQQKPVCLYCSLNMSVLNLLCALG